MNSKANAASIAYDMLARSVSQISSHDATDIYALSFYIYDYDDDPRLPTITLGYNTRSNYEASIANASDKNEAKWNYAFWLQNELCIVGEPGTESAAALESWIDDLGLSYSDEEEKNDSDRCIELDQAITKQFIQLAVELAQHLHTSGLIEKKFNKSIPIIVHELDYYDEIVAQTRRANTPGLAEEFARWVDEM
jgi:hypothetical protein